MEHLCLLLLDGPLGWYFGANNISSMISEDCDVSRVQYKENDDKTKRISDKKAILQQAAEYPWCKKSS